VPALFYYRVWLHRHNIYSNNSNNNIFDNQINNNQKYKTMKHTEFRAKEWKCIENISLYYTACDDNQKKELINRLRLYLFKEYGFVYNPDSFCIQSHCDQINMYDTLSSIIEQINKHLNYKARMNVIDTGCIDLRIFELKDTQKSIK
jgi:hypothetical protein